MTEESADAVAPVQLTALPAACGDCLVVEYQSDSGAHRILIDGGLGSKYDVGLGQHLTASGDGPAQFDVVIVTHVDRDHIDGVIRALREQHLQSADIWFNGRDEIDALVNGGTRGVRQGDELSALIPADLRNRVVDGQAIHVPPTGPVRFELPGDATLHAAVAVARAAGEAARQVAGSGAGGRRSHRGSAEGARRPAHPGRR